MATRYDVLPKSQRDLLPALAPLQDLGFVLYGGTAIALQLGHRMSIDFDFFCDRAADKQELVDVVPMLRDVVTLQDEAKTWTIQTRPKGDDRPVKLSFFSELRFGRVGIPLLGDDQDLLMASLDDLLGHKLKVLLQRVEEKDYRDIAAMLDGGQSLERGLGASISLFPNFPAAEAIKALVYFEDGDLSELSDVDRAVLIKHADACTAPIDLPILSRCLDRTDPGRS